MCTKIMSKTMISKRPRRLSSRMLILAVYTIVAVVQIVSADSDTSSLAPLIKGQDTNNTQSDEPAARLLKEKLKADTNRDLQDSAADGSSTYTINALASRLSKPGQNQGRQANFKRRKNNGGNGGDKNTSGRQSSGSSGGGRVRQTNGGVGAARNEGRKNRNSNKPQQQGTANNQNNRKPAVSTVNNNNAKPQGNRQNKPVGIHGPQKPQQQQKKNNVRNKNGNNNANGTRRKKVPMAARTSNLVVVKNKQKQTNAGTRPPNIAQTAGNARNSHANGFMTTLYGSSGGGKGGGGKGNMRNKNGGGGKKKKMNNGRKRRNGGKNAWSAPTWSVDEMKVWDAGWGTEGIYKPSSSNGWGASSSASKDSWTDDGWTRADWIELPEREECPCVMVDNPEYIAAQWSSSGQWEPIWGTVEDSSSNVQPAWGEPTWMTQQAWGPSWSDTSWAAPAWETQSAWGGTWNGGPVIKASSSSSYTSPWSGSTWWGGRKQRRLDATGTKSRKRRRRRRLGSKSSGGKGGGGKSNDNDKSSGDSADTVEVKQASAWSSSAWESTEKIPEKIKVCTCMPTVSIYSMKLVYHCRVYKFAHPLSIFASSILVLSNISTYILSHDVYAYKYANNIRANVSTIEAVFFVIWCMHS